MPLQIDTVSSKAAQKPATVKVNSAEASGEGAVLSDGTKITYDQARLFMEYYCKRFDFGKPEVTFESTMVRMPKGRNSVQRWESVMTVGGRRIGMGSVSDFGRQMSWLIERLI